MGHSEVVMCDFAACLLAELERWMLNASPAMIDLNSFADNSDYFSAPTSALEEVSKRLYSDVVCFAGLRPSHARPATPIYSIKIWADRYALHQCVMLCLHQDHTANAWESNIPA